MQDLTPIIQILQAYDKQIKELTAKVNAVYFTLLDTEHGQKAAHLYEQWNNTINQLQAQAEGEEMIKEAFNPQDDLSEMLRRQIAEYRQRHENDEGGHPLS